MINAIMWFYGCTKNEAFEYHKNLNKKTKDFIKNNFDNRHKATSEK